MAHTPAVYVFSIEPERLHKHPRYHWTICSAQDPDTLVSWGHAPSRELAEAAAQGEIEELRTGSTAGGRVRVRNQSLFRYCHR